MLIDYIVGYFIIMVNKGTSSFTVRYRNKKKKKDKKKEKRHVS